MHDGPLQTLHAAVMHLEWSVAQFRGAPSQLAEQLGHAAAMVRGACEEIRRDVLGQGPRAEADPLAELELRLCAMSRASGASIAVRCTAPGEVFRDSAALARDVTMVAREAVSNAIRHGGPSRIEVEIDTFRGCEGLMWLRVVVSDNGWGHQTNPGERPGRPGGLTNLTERARHWHGRCELGTSRDGGAQLVWEVPVRGGVTDGSVDAV